MRGTKCKCGFSTVAEDARCPRCGKKTQKADWPDTGKVLSFAELKVEPEGFEDLADLAVVHIDDEGPKICCWATELLKPGDSVKIIEKDDGRYRCERARSK